MSGPPSPRRLIDYCSPLFPEALKSPINAKIERLVQRFGQTCAETIAHTNKILFIFPNLVINDLLALNIRTFFPGSPRQVNDAVGTQASATRAAKSALRGSTRIVGVSKTVISLVLVVYGIGGILGTMVGGHVGSLAAAAHVSGVSGAACPGHERTTACDCIFMNAVGGGGGGGGDRVHFQHSAGRRDPEIPGGPQPEYRRCAVEPQHQCDTTRGGLGSVSWFRVGRSFFRADFALGRRGFWYSAVSGAADGRHGRPRRRTTTGRRENFNLASSLPSHPLAWSDLSD